MSASQSHHSLSFIFFLSLFIISYAAQEDDHDSTAPTHLVDRVCKITQNYTSCVKTLYTDPRTPDADAYTLAYISFDLAYQTATDTRRRITVLLSGNSKERGGLHRCLDDYDKAVAALNSALNDLNSETYFTLASYANTTSKSADDCQSHYKPLDSVSINSISQICIAVAKLFNDRSST